MKEFIFTWNIENISHSWHKQQEAIVSPPFVADTLQNTVWNLSLYPRGYFYDEWLSLYLFRGQDEGPEEFYFDFELSCVSANNLTFSCAYEQISASKAKVQAVGEPRFLQIREVFAKRKALYLPRDILTLHCRMWRLEGDVDEFGQCFGCTRLEIERILSVEDMNSRINKEKTVFIHSNKQNKLLISIDVSQEKDGLKMEVHPVNTEQIKCFTFKFSAVWRKRKLCKYVTTWLDKPRREVWKVPFSNIGKKASILNKLKLTCEFSYTIGEEAKSIEKVSPCLFKFPEFPSTCILSCISSRKLSDCPSMYKDLWDLYAKRILCDVELKTQTTSFWVHKTVLCARSPVFLGMFTNEMKEKVTNCIEIEDLEDDTLEKLITFFYTDTFEEAQWDTLVEVYYSADKYQVGPLKNFCCSCFMNKIDVLNACELLILADRHNDSDLKWKVEDYIAKNRKSIFMSPTWKQFSDKQPLLAARTMICEYEKDREKQNAAKTHKSSSYLNYIDDFKSVYNSKIGSDIVIQTTTAVFPAHKIILCASSSKLREMFASGKSTDSLKVEDLEDDILSRLLLFLYTDSLGDMKWETATKLYHAAVAYQIERLKIKCSCFFLVNLNVSNASNLLQVALEHRDVRLKSLVEDFISLSDKKIRVSKGLTKLGKTDPPKRIETRLSKRLRLEKDS